MELKFYKNNSINEQYKELINELAQSSMIMNIYLRELANLDVPDTKKHIEIINMCGAVIEDSCESIYQLKMEYPPSELFIKLFNTIIGLNESNNEIINKLESDYHDLNYIHDNYLTDSFMNPNQDNS